MRGFNDYEEIIHRHMIPLAIKESEKNVQKIISVIRGRFDNPFQFQPENDELRTSIDIASGVALQEDLAGAFLISKETGREAMIDFVDKRINSKSETLDKRIAHNFGYPLSRMFHEVKPKEKEMTKLGLCRQTELELCLVPSYSKERLTFRNYLLMSLQVYLWL